MLRGKARMRMFSASTSSHLHGDIDEAHLGGSSQAGRREGSRADSLRSALRSIASYACPL